MNLGRLLPVWDALRNYDRRALWADLLAGLTTGVMLVPQAMGYALLADLPPVVGLYASLAPLVVYALLGTSRQLAVGPVAMDSLLVAVTVGAIAQSGTDAYLSVAILLGAMVGIIQVALGALGMGFLVNFLSRPVLSGFTSAAALIIGFSQLSHLLAIPLPSGHSIIHKLSHAVSVFDEWNVIALTIGSASIGSLVLLKTHAPKIPRAMLVIAAGTLAVSLFGLETRGVAIVGKVPAGLPGLALPDFNGELLLTLLPGAFTIALVAFVEAISVGKHLAQRDGYDVQPGRELIALGAANVAGSLMGGYPVTGGFSRSAVNAEAGARTQLAGLSTAAIVAVTLLVLTPLFEQLPKAALAAIIVGAVGGLFDAKEAKRLWRIKRADFWLLSFTFVATLGVGIQYGILLGVGLSLLNFLVQTTRPHFAVLGRIPGTESYLNVKRHPTALTIPGVIVLRVDAQIYFGNISFLKDLLKRLENESPTPLTALVLDASGINQLDSSAETALSELDASYRARNVRVLWAHVKGPVRDVMERTGLLQRLQQEQRYFLRTHDAVQAASAHPAPLTPPRAA